MPPCGYRPLAVESIRCFLLDNLDYFIDLYLNRGLSLIDALKSEADEIEKIRQGKRGSTWSRIVVELNAEFYSQLSSKQLKNWDEVRSSGESIIANMIAELTALSPP